MMSKKHIPFGSILGWLGIPLLILLLINCAPHVFYAKIIERFSAAIPANKRSLFQAGTAAKIIWLLKSLLLTASLGLALIFHFRARIRKILRQLRDDFSASLKWSAQSAGDFLSPEAGIHRGAFFLILLIAFGLRLHYLFSTPLYNDEVYTFLKYAVRPFYQPLLWYKFQNNHVLHTLLVHIAYVLFGDQPWVIRLPAFCFGTSLVVITYAFARYLFGKTTGLWAMALVATSTKIIQYTTNARGHILICVFFLLGIFLAESIRRSPASLLKWLCLSLVFSLGLFTVPVMLYPAVTLYAWLILSYQVRDIRDDDKKFIRYWFASIAATAGLSLTLYCPILIVHALLKYDQLKLSFSANDFSRYIETLRAALSKIFADFTLDIPRGIVWLLGIGFIVFLCRSRKMGQSKILFWPVLFTLLATIHSMIWYFLPYGRYWLYLLPLFFTHASAGIVELAKTAARKILPRGSTLLQPAAALLPLFLCVYLAVLVYQKNSLAFNIDQLKDVKQIALFFKNELRPGDRIYSEQPSDTPLIYYFHYYLVPTAPLISDSEILDSKTLCPATFEPKQMKRLFFLINEEAGQDLAASIRNNPILAPYTPARFVKKFDLSTLYVYNMP
ncbi:MAG: glycosyltransferase family 39 protein [Candidatus Omnitrophica bacterium]|nr:glycosyltransferase family 39 protein [Candidatus Omnitrophota bacterium]